MPRIIVQSEVILAMLTAQYRAGWRDGHVADADSDEPTDAEAGNVAYRHLAFMLKYSPSTVQQEEEICSD